MNQASDVIVAEASAAPTLAKRRWRFVAAFIDGLLQLVIVMPLLYFTGVLNELDPETPPSLAQTLMLLVWVFAAFTVVNFHLLKTRGQTVGKWFLNIAIVGTDGKPKPVQDLLLKRYLPYLGVGVIPVIGGVLSLVNVLFILGKPKRCVHDYIADTKVIEVQ